MRRTAYLVRFGAGRIARFSDAPDAYHFARLISPTVTGLVEISDKSGLVGQYIHGRPTKEFELHDQSVPSV